MGFMNAVRQQQDVPEDGSGEQSPALASYVGRYRIVAELGRGGMANVFLAVAQGPLGVQKLVVLKALRAALAAEPEALSMFLEEARLAAQLNHANVVQTYEVGAEGDRHVIVMEYLEGQPLSAVLRRGSTAGASFPLAAQLRVIISMLEGLHYAHELTSYAGVPLNLVHRDVSPQNVFLTYDGQVKLLDFGIAKAATSQNHTAAGVIKGKLAYMAPEQMVASRVDRRADVYSVGCILWAAAAGEKLWRTTPSVEIVQRVVSGKVPSPVTVNPACDCELERIVMKALHCDVEHRYASALALQEDLEKYCEQVGGIVKQKEVGAYVSSLFEDTQAQLKTAIERELKLAAAAPLPTSSGYRDTIVDLQGETQAAELEAFAAEDREASAHPPGERRLWFAALLLALLAGAALVVRSRLAQSQQANRSPVARSLPAVSATTESRSGVAHHTATFELKAEPPSAQLSLDGVPLTGNPVTKLLVQDGSIHQFSAVAQGFESASKQFSAASSGSLFLALSPSATNSKRRGVTRTWAAPAARALPAPVAAAASASPAPVASQHAPLCDQPFYFNAQGIKAVRPECL